MNEQRRAALVTGGAVRVGRAIVEELARRGWAVAFSYHTSLAPARELEAALRHEEYEVHAIPAELSSAAARRELVEAAVARLGRLDALINNAAVFPRTPIDELTEAALHEVLRTNLEAPLFLALACAPHLRQRSGAVVNIADIHGLQPLRHHLAYSVSKAALIAATRALAVELAPAIRVNAIAPGIAVFPPDYDERTRARLVNRTLLGRQGSPEEIARAVRFTLEDATTMTGQVLVIDAGRTVEG